MLENEISRVPFGTQFGIQNGTHGDNQKKINVNTRQYIIKSFLMSEL